MVGKAKEREQNQKDEQDEYLGNSEAEHGSPAIGIVQFHRTRESFYGSSCTVRGGPAGS